MGGGIGSIFRFLMSNYTQKLLRFHTFPMGTLLVNLLGCFVIGMLSAYFIKEDNQLKFLLITGFCGGFTTFSTFSAESLSLWQEGSFFLLAVYVVSSVILGILAVVLGFKIMGS